MQIVKMMSTNYTHFNGHIEFISTNNLLHVSQSTNNLFKKEEYHLQNILVRTYMYKHNIEGLVS